MAKKSIKRNYFYNLFYQVLLLVTPLITAPYLSRILEADGIGTVSFAESVASYFVLFAALGLNTFGQREISYSQDNREKRSQTFWEIKCLGFITSAIIIILYIPFSLMQTNRSIYFVLTFHLFAVFVDITWLFQGLEEFGKIVFRNCIFKIISIVYIFIMVKSKDDLVWYAFGQAFFLFLSNGSLWLYLPKYVDPPKWESIKPFRNLKTVVALFIPTIAIQVYTVLDKTMIGLITNSAVENGYYEQAIKISRMALTLVTALGTVMIPRIGFHFNKKEYDKVREFLYNSYRFAWFLGVPLCFGIIGTASNFVPWFFGDGFDRVVPLLKILSFLILAIGINNVTGIQYLIPTKRENLFTLTVVIGAIVNCLMNLLLIRILKSIGAAIASVTAESIIAIVQLYLVKNDLSIRKVFSCSWHYFISGGVMLLVLNWIGSRFASSVINTAAMALLGAFVYLSILLLLKDEFLVQNIESVKKIKDKLK